MTVWLKTFHRRDYQTNPRDWHVKQFTCIIFLTSWGRVRMLFTQDCGYNRNVSLLQDTFRMSPQPLTAPLEDPGSTYEWDFRQLIISTNYGFLVKQV